MTIAELKEAMFLLQMKDCLGPHCLRGLPAFAQMDAYARQIRQLELMLASPNISADNDIL